MHDMTAKKEALFAYTPHPNFAKWHKLFPTSAWLRRQAPRNVPRFAFEYGDTGAGNDVGIQHNWAAFDSIKITPRYGVVVTPPPVDVELFGQRYSAPIGIAPMGGPSLVWPGADLIMARAAQRARVPYTLSVAGGASIEQAAKAAPDVFWLQIYRFWRDDHKIGFDLMRRAAAVDVKVLTLTLDVPVRTTRSRETYAGLGGEFRPNARMLSEMLVRPKWLMALMRNGYPRFATIGEYAKSRQHQRDHPLRARQYGRRLLLGRGQALPRRLEGQDGGERRAASGRRREGGGDGHRRHLGVEPWRPPDRGAHAVDRLPAGGRRRRRQQGHHPHRQRRARGQDVMRALALGADAAFAGKSFLWAVAALGEEGPAQLIDLYIDELRASLGQIGALSPAEARQATVHHPGAIRF